MPTLYRPSLLFAGGKFHSGSGLLAGDDGRILAIAPNAESASVVDLPGKALLPGFINAHSHSFQRLIRGKSESRVTSGKDFWSWRGTMYHAAAQLTPRQAHDVARMAFLEMALAGTTTVGEFHYLHTDPAGRPYDDPNHLAKLVIAAARSVGIRIVLLRAAYFRSGYQLSRDPGQTRFFESLPDYLRNTALLKSAFPASVEIAIGVAPHSIRAVPLNDLREIAAFARSAAVPLHMHVSEQTAENEASVREYGTTPVTLLANAHLLGPHWTAIHATHITADEMEQLAEAGMTICACPTTERNLGDGIFCADRVMEHGIPVALGSDSQAQIDPLEDARQLDYHLRLKCRQRAILDQIPNAQIPNVRIPNTGQAQPLAQRLFACATANGARSLAVQAGDLAIGSLADFFTVDLRDPSIAGHSAADLLPLIVFGLNRTAIRDVAVGGQLVVRDGRHPLQNEIIARYAEIHAAVWRDVPGSSA
ncbi:MAG TPA: formimidoylglutamate deiminase [Acidobacteriaceae bacterium]|jgi:formimidoylglutamate deiminase|nr:formimidoylglutamate deiminase [Acidobacteriaceae bacterium]